MVLRNARHHRREVRLCLVQGHARLQTPDNFQVVTTAIRKFFRVQCYRHPQPHVAFHKLKTRRHDANDGVLLAVELNVAIDDLWIAAVTRLPESVTQYYDFMRSGTVVLGNKCAPKSRRDTK